MSLFDKARVITLGNLNELFDKVGDLNSTAVVKQRIRDMEDAKKQMQVQAGAARGRMNNAQSELDGIKAHIELNDKQITMILGDGDDSNNYHAKPLEAEIVGLEQEIPAKQQIVEAHKQTFEQINAALQRIVGEHAKMVTQLKKLESASQVGDAFKAGNAALSAAEKISSAIGNQSVDNLADRINEQAAVEKAKFEDAAARLGGAGSVEQTVQDIEVEQRLKARMERLAAAKSATAQ